MSKWDAPKKFEETNEQSRWNLDVQASVEPVTVKDQPRKSNFNSRWDKPVEGNPEEKKDENEASKQTEGQIPENTQQEYKLPEALTQPEKVEGLPQGESEVLPMLKPEDVTYFSALL